MGVWIGLVVILADVARGMAIKVRAAVVAHFLDVVPYIALAEVHSTMVRGVLVLALHCLEQFQEVGQADPLAALAGAFAHLARGIAGVGLALQVGGFTCRQVGLTIAVRAAVLDIDFEHRLSPFWPLKP